MALYAIEGGALIRREDTELLRIEPWGRDAIRVRVTRNPEIDFSQDWALIPRKETGKAGFAQADANATFGSAADIRLIDPQAVAERIGDGNANAEGGKATAFSRASGARVTNGNLTAELNGEGWIRFVNAKGETLLEEYWRNRKNLERFTSPLNLDAREIQGNLGGAWRACFRFEAREGEKIFGMGQYQDPYLDKKGSTLELAHRNAQSSVPFYLSNLGYGFLWNNPAVGRADFARNVTQWSASVTDQADYWICAADTPSGILERYTAVTGRVPEMPEYGLGFTQCRMRYRNQEELMGVAREHKRRGLPMDMIVADFFHWTAQGDWRFDPEDWPDVPGMVSELKSLGIELMVSIWPTVDTRSENRRAMEERGFLIQAERSLRINMNWMGETAFFDATNPGARDFIWSKARENYFKHGIKTFWLDEAEPEFGVYDFDLFRYWLGPALKVTNLYPVMYVKAFYDGLSSEGVENPLSLVRTAWAGSQRYGALVWSGDIHSSFRSMREQLAAGLSMGLAGIPWWTSDIGGFHSGYTENEDFRELLVRWFQWGTLCPVFRLHGDRSPYRPPQQAVRNGIQQFGSGSDNEIWSFGEKAYPVLRAHLRLRERLRPYIRGLHRAAAETGEPIMRPLFFDFPDDVKAWDYESAYMFGPDLLVAPILEAGVTERQVYLPAGARWKNAHTGTIHDGGSTVTAPAPWEHIPLFVRDGAALPILEA